MRVTLLAAAAAGWLACTIFGAEAQSHIKIGILNDQSGPYSDVSGRGAVVAAQLAIGEFQKSHPRIDVQLVIADHQNKPDIAAGIARQWLDVDGVDAIADLQNSSIAAAVQNIAHDRKKVSLVTGAVTPSLTGESCSPTGVVWSMDAYSLALGPVQALSDKKKWFFITVDLAGGLLFESEGVAAVSAAGGQFVGSARHPLGTPDMSAYLLQAQASGANVLALANAGADTINAIKGANEFGMRNHGIAIAPLLMFEPDIKAVGLEIAQGMVIGTGFYWDLNDDTRAFSKSFMERFKRVPTQYQASVYAAVRHYLEAVAAVGSTDSAAVTAKMRELPAYYFSDHPAHIRPDGRVTYDVNVMQVKTPSESKGEWDLLRLVKTIPAEAAFRPLDQSTCPLLKAG